MPEELPPLEAVLKLDISDFERQLERAKALGQAFASSVFTAKATVDITDALGALANFRAAAEQAAAEPIKFKATVDPSQALADLAAAKKAMDAEAAKAVKVKATLDDADLKAKAAEDVAVTDALGDKKIEIPVGLDQSRLDAQLLEVAAKFAALRELMGGEIRLAGGGILPPIPALGMGGGGAMQAWPPPWFRSYVPPPPPALGGAGGLVPPAWWHATFGGGGGGFGGGFGGMGGGFGGGAGALPFNLDEWSIRQAQMRLASMLRGVAGDQLKIPVDVETASALTKITDLQARIRMLSEVVRLAGDDTDLAEKIARMQVMEKNLDRDARLGLDTTAARAEFEAFRAEIEARTTQMKLARYMTGGMAAEQVAQAAAQLDKIAQTRPDLAPFITGMREAPTMDVGEAKAALTDLAAQAERLKKLVMTAQMDPSEALAAMQILKAEKDSLGKEEVFTFRAENAAFLASIEEMRLALDALIAKEEEAKAAGRFGGVGGGILSGIGGFFAGGGGIPGGLLGGLGAVLGPEIAGIAPLGAGAIGGGAVLAGLSGIRPAMQAYDQNKLQSGQTTIQRNLAIIQSNQQLLQSDQALTNAVTAQNQAMQQSAYTTMQARQALANTNITTANQVQQAAAALRNTEKTGAYSVQQAEQALTQQRLNSADSVRSAEQGVQQAQIALTNATWQEQQAQVALVLARQQAQFQLQNYKNQLADAALAQEAAYLGVKQSLLSMQQTMADPSASQLSRQQAELAYQQSVQQVADQTTAYNQLKTTSSEAFQKGVSGNTQVVQALHAVATAVQNVQQAHISLSNARLSLSRADYNAIVGMQQATKALSMAEYQRAYSTNQAENALIQARYQRSFSMKQAHQALTQAELTGAQQVAQAITAVTQARAADVQAHHAHALTAKQQQGTAATLAQAFADISPEGRKFVKWYYGPDGPDKLFHDFSKSMQTLLLPSVMTAFKDLEPIFKALTGPSGPLTAAGKGIGDFITGLSGWAKTHQKDVVGVFKDGNAIFKELGVVVTNLFEVFTKMSPESSKVLVSFAQGFNTLVTAFGKWGESKQGHQFFDALKKDMPAIAGALASLGTAFYNALPSMLASLPSLLNGLTSILNVVNDIVKALDKMHLGGVFGDLAAIYIMSRIPIIGWPLKYGMKGAYGLGKWLGKGGLAKIFGRGGGAAAEGEAGLAGEAGMAGEAGVAGEAGMAGLLGPAALGLGPVALGIGALGAGALIGTWIRHTFVGKDIQNWTNDLFGISTQIREVNKLSIHVPVSKKTLDDVALLRQHIKELTQLRWQTPNMQLFWSTTMQTEAEMATAFYEQRPKTWADLGKKRQREFFEQTQALEVSHISNFNTFRARMIETWDAIVHSGGRNAAANTGKVMGKALIDNLHAEIKALSRTQTYQEFMSTLQQVGATPKTSAATLAMLEEQAGLPVLDWTDARRVWQKIRRYERDIFALEHPGAARHHTEHHHHVNVHVHGYVGSEHKLAKHVGEHVRDHLAKVSQRNGSPLGHHGGPRHGRTRGT